jgi:hypothetical protein
MSESAAWLDDHLNSEAVEMIIESVTNRIYKKSRRAYAIDSVEMDLVRVIVPVVAWMMKEFAQTAARQAVGTVAQEIQEQLNEAKAIAEENRQESLALGDHVGRLMDTQRALEEQMDVMQKTNENMNTALAGIQSLINAARRGGRSAAT